MKTVLIFFIACAAVCMPELSKAAIWSSARCKISLDESVSAENLPRIVDQLVSAEILLGAFHADAMTDLGTVERRRTTFQSPSVWWKEKLSESAGLLNATATSEEYKIKFTNDLLQKFVEYFSVPLASDPMLRRQTIEELLATSYFSGRFRPKVEDYLHARELFSRVMALPGGRELFIHLLRETNSVFSRRLAAMQDGNNDSSRVMNRMMVGVAGIVPMMMGAFAGSSAFAAYTALPMFAYSAVGMVNQKLDISRSARLALMRTLEKRRLKKRVAESMKVFSGEKTAIEDGVALESAPEGAVSHALKKNLRDISLEKIQALEPQLIPGNYDSAATYGSAVLEVVNDSIDAFGLISKRMDDFEALVGRLTRAIEPTQKSLSPKDAAVLTERGLELSSEFIQSADKALLSARALETKLAKYIELGEQAEPQFDDVSRSELRGSVTELRASLSGMGASLVSLDVMIRGAKAQRLALRSIRSSLRAQMLVQTNSLSTLSDVVEKIRELEKERQGMRPARAM